MTAFDISKKAIEWARTICPEDGIEFCVANLFDPPANWAGYFDLIVEVYTIQALPLSLREKAVAAIASFVRESGELIVVQRLRNDDIGEPGGPPWAVSREELKWFIKCGLKEREFKTYQGDEEEPITRFVAVFAREG